MKQYSTLSTLTAAAVFAGIAAFGTLAGPASAATIPFDVEFGSNHDGAAGFTQVASEGAWSTGTEALRYTYDSSGTGTASAAQQFTNIAATAGKKYELSLSTTIVNNGTGNSNRFGARLFATDATSGSTGLTILFSYNNSTASSNTLAIRDGFPGTGAALDSEVWASPTGNATDGVTFTIFGTFEYVGSNIDISFQVTDGTTTSNAVTASVVAATYTGDFFGFGSRAEQTATFDYQTFTLNEVPEPASLALLGLGGLCMLGGRRRRLA